MAVSTSPERIAADPQLTTVDDTVERIAAAAPPLSDATRNRIAHLARRDTLTDALRATIRGGAR